MGDRRRLGVITPRCRAEVSISGSPGWDEGIASSSSGWPSADRGLTGLPAKQDAGSSGGVDGGTRIETIET